MAATLFGLYSRRSRIGRAKAAVFPEPACNQIITYQSDGVTTAMYLCTELQVSECRVAVIS